MGKGVYQRIGVFGMDFKRNNRAIEKALLKKNSVRYGFQKCVFVWKNGWKYKVFQGIALLIIK